MCWCPQSPFAAEQACQRHISFLELDNLFLELTVFVKAHQYLKIYGIAVYVW